MTASVIGCVVLCAEKTIVVRLAPNGKLLFIAYLPLARVLEKSEKNLQLLPPIIIKRRENLNQKN